MHVSSRIRRTRPFSRPFQEYVFSMSPTRRRGVPLNRLHMHNGRGMGNYDEILHAEVQWTMYKYV